MILDVHARLQERDQAKLDAAGLSDVKLEIGWFQVGDRLRLEPRLTGPEPSKQKARELLGLPPEQ